MVNTLARFGALEVLLKKVIKLNQSQFFLLNMSVVKVY